MEVMTSHEFARMLLRKPDLPIYVDISVGLSSKQNIKTPSVPFVEYCRQSLDSKNRPVLDDWCAGNENARKIILFGVDPC
jgi:hypothetical protein